MTARKGHARSRPLPHPVDDEMPKHLRDLTLCAMVGTLNAPIGCSLQKIYLEAARNLIRAATSMSRKS